MKKKLAIIGGSGLYNFEELKEKKVIPVQKGPFGENSGEIIHGILEGVEIYFLPRHGKNHSYNPSNVPYRANIDSLKRLGCMDIISVSAVGSLKEELNPGKFVLVDQFIDRTFLRKKTFFDKNIVAHVSLAEPTCKLTTNLVYDAAIKANIDIKKGGTYLAMEGPQFSTLAESRLYQSWGCEVIGMTNMPEAKLAREAEMRYVSIAMVTDYDCWRNNDENVNVEEIIKTLDENAEKAKSLISFFVKEFSERRPKFIDGIDNVLDTAIITSSYSNNELIELGLDGVASRIINEGW